MLASLRRVLNDDTPGLRARVIGIYALLLSVNVILWAITLLTAVSSPVILALGASAYTLGLRHAVDADHIAAIDNVTRKLMQEKKKPAAIGLFFSLGHSTVVFIIAVLVGLGAAFIRSGISNKNSPLESTAGLIGTGVSAFFLLAMAVINLVILVQIVQAFRDISRGGVYSDEVIDQVLNQRGFFARIFRGLFKSIDRSWKMYPVGILFGLGFDTATEIGLFVLAGSIGTFHVPFYSAFLLPLLFTAGMTLADTTDGVTMLGAYGWAFVKPIRKLFYNMTITMISVLVALVIGGLETLSIVSGQLNLSGPFWDFVGTATSGENFGWIGAGIIAVFILSWLISTIIYKVNKYDDIEVARLDGPARAG
ncbi:MAG TPA: HoxN/HupN/NixA family nickel/cobalt transporter [Ktedonobacterales bacterium]|nr:HoxN/HupN/NixA family nickel/cobalt transporter [Ktedonobacterales bacterium]